MAQQLLRADHQRTCRAQCRGTRRPVRRRYSRCRRWRHASADPATRRTRRRSCPSAAPGNAGTCGRPPVAMTMCRAVTMRPDPRPVTMGGPAKVAQPRARFDPAFRQILLVDAVQPRDIGLAAAPQGRPVMPAWRDVETHSPARRGSPAPICAAFHMTFFGTQPTLTQVPPRRADSITSARAPYSAARCAQASPPLPPPITIRSKSFAHGAILHRLAAAECSLVGMPTI